MAGPGRDDGLGPILRRADPARWLSSRFVDDRERRADIVALYAFDHELERAGRAASSALLTEIRLAWWREALDEIFAGRPPRPHPVTRALARVVARRDLPRAPLQSMIDGRVAILGQGRLGWEAACALAEATGASAAVLAAAILDPDAPPGASSAAGRAWSLFRLHEQAGIAQPDAATRIRAALDEARAAALSLSAAAFPAVAHATLIRARRRSGPIGGLEARGRLLAAILTGRL